MRKLRFFSGLMLFALLQLSPVFVQFVNAAPDTLVFCATLENAALPENNQAVIGEGAPGATACSAHIWSTQQIDNLCGGLWISYSVRLFLFNTSEYVDIKPSTDVPFQPAATMEISFDTRDSVLGPQNSISQNGVPYTARTCAEVNSYHRIVWTVLYDCNMSVTYEYLIRVVDCEAPDPLCVGTTQIVFPVTGSVTLYARDFNLESVDDCSPADSLRYSFSAETYQSSKRFDCDVLHCGPLVMVQIWVADQGSDLNCDGIIEWNERNKSACSAPIFFEDNADHPCSIEPLTFSGTIETEEHKPVSQVTVFLSAHGAILDQSTTAGIFQFNDPCPRMPLTDLRIHCEKNDGHKIGVSTLDIVKIQKHLLGIQLLESPYKLIAADANNNGSISVLDLIEIRKLILGVFNEFPKSPSWRFVPKNYVFQNPENPWSFQDTLHVISPVSNNFIGIKIGDVNGNATNEINRTTPVVKQSTQFRTDDRFVINGEFLEVPVFASDVKEILGFQFTLSTQGLVFDGIEPGALDISSECIGIHEKAITMSWATPVPATSVAGETLFTLRFTATENGSLREMLKITSDITEAEAYVAANSNPDGIDVTDIALVVSANSFAGPKSHAFALYQNTPNPFNDQTQIGFDLPVAMSATLTIYDVHGRVIHSVDSKFNQGYNVITVKAQDLKSGGVYFYRLNADNFTASKKFILSVE